MQPVGAGEVEEVWQQRLRGIEAHAVLAGRHQPHSVPGEEAQHVVADARSGAQHDKRNELMRQTIASRRRHAAPGAVEGETALFDRQPSPVEADKTGAIGVRQPRRLESEASGQHSRLRRREQQHAVAERTVPAHPLWNGWCLQAILSATRRYKQSQRTWHRSMAAFSFGSGRVHSCMTVLGFA